MSPTAVSHRGRFAPSPTGKMHLGNARSALLGWLWARAEGGEFWLRMEDLDAARSRPEHVVRVLEDLRYLGLTWEGPLLIQSERAELYDTVLKTLASQGRTYPCFCSRAEIARAVSAPHGPLDDGPVYPQTCLALTPDERKEKARQRPAALRFRPRAGEFRFTDGVKGSRAQDVAQEVGDFVVQRNDGVASYQLAVVVDDHASGITHVLRGEDLLGSTPRQLQLYEALGWTPPHFAHVPLLLGEDGKRLAKREGPSAIADLRAAGVPAEKLLGVLAKWSGLSDGRPTTAQALVSGFALENISRDPVVVCEADLRF